ncbi:MAG TPA: cytochrome c [Sphingomicrobium sp.]|nr:cytochrome c [Sphingomicrobium sp.]
MRFTTFAAACACVLLTGCGDWKSGQANNATANISEDSRPAPTAVATTTAMRTTAPATKEEALEIMHERHEGMEGMGKATKAIGRELKSDSPDLGVIRESARKITDFAPRSAVLFPPGTGPDVGKTGAKPEIWQNAQDFAAKDADFQRAAQAFGTAVSSGELTAIKAKFADLGNTCKACHDKYRAKMKH